jgi:uncharacterized membrane protein
MKAKDIRFIEWLYAQLPDLISEGILSPETESKLRSRYGELPAPKQGRAAMAVFAILGSILVGLGIILLFAFNWRELPRIARVVLACLPLLVSIVLGAYTLMRRMDSLAWREAVSALMSLCLAGALALIGQTYQIPGDTAEFLVACILLSLPLVYIFDSNIVQLLYLVGISAWSGIRQGNGEQAAAFWIFFALILPRIAFHVKKDRHSTVSTASLWSVVACLSVCLGVCLEKIMPGLWIILYGSFFSCLYLADKLWLEGPERAFERPFSTTGSLGIIVLAFILSYSWPWKEIGWEWIRQGERFKSEFAWLDYLTVGLVFSLSIALLVMSFLKRTKRDPAFGFFPVASGISYALVSKWGDTGPVLVVVHLIMNVFILYSGVMMILSGLRKRRIGDINLGAFIVSLLIALRFIFEDDFFENLVARGLVFIVLGLAFLAMNVILARVYREARK